MKKKFSTVSLTTDDLDRLREVAEEERRSMAQQISYWLDQHKARKESA